jgi:hypothetical protein
MRGLLIGKTMSLTSRNGEVGGNIMRRKRRLQQVHVMQSEANITQRNTRLPCRKGVGLHLMPTNLHKFSQSFYFFIYFLLIL